MSDDVEFLEVIPCPYCGRPAYRDYIERPVDYCHHEDAVENMTVEEL